MSPSVEIEIKAREWIGEGDLDRSARLTAPRMRESHFAHNEGRAKSDQRKRGDIRGLYSSRIKVAKEGSHLRRRLKRFEDIDAAAIVNVGVGTAVIGPSNLLVAGQDELGHRLTEWPRFGQMLSVGILVIICFLSTGGIVSAGLGLGLGFLSLSLLFFANFAAWRKGVGSWFVGPHVAMIGCCCSFVIAIAVTVNAVLL